ncbi:hypothetical protein, partial [Pandoraea sputorum]|uniref:hypothetical protein n=1 Tax=Pandoraea sputorum TaxID=93222 RepID=UPI00355726F5
RHACKPHVFTHLHAITLLVSGFVRKLRHSAMLRKIRTVANSHQLATNCTVPSMARQHQRRAICQRLV